MSTTHADTPTPTSRNAATGEPPLTGDALRTAAATSPAPAGAAELATSLPRRIRDDPPAARPGRKAQPPAGPETLRRVLDGLNRL
jgi:hypothetical protein